MIRRWIAALTAALALCLTLTACGGGGEEQGAYDLTLPQTLIDAGAFSEALEPLDADLVSSYYGLEAQPQEAAVYASTGATAETAAVLCFADEDAAASAVTALETWIADQKDACRDYLPAELPKLDDAILERAGTTVLLVVANDYDRAQTALDG